MEFQPNSHLSYCSNIHPGESWQDTFSNLKTHIPVIKQQVSPDQPFGIGLRLSNEASSDLAKPEQLEALKSWLKEADCYVFTMNGFPFGGFHDQVIKDKVHAPDWSTPDRLAYTKRLADILAQLLPEGVIGGISTSPLSYRWWHQQEDFDQVKTTCTTQLMDLVIHLQKLKQQTGKSIHIDMEPEPDGLLETGQEFIDYYQKFLLGEQLSTITEAFACSKEEAKIKLKEHIQLCYDICHYAVEYEEAAPSVEQLKTLNIPVGKIQISAALKARLGTISDRMSIKEDLQNFVEPNYLHQAVLKQRDGALTRFKDLDIALKEIDNDQFTELRTHYHVPLFTETYGNLKSTQDEIVNLLSIWKEKPFCSHLEVETYTWGVLPSALKKDIDASIIRELEWVLNTVTR